MASPLPPSPGSSPTTRDTPFAHPQRPPSPHAGESYAGVYVPNLARAVLEGNERGEEPQINLQVKVGKTG